MRRQLGHFLTPPSMGRGRLLKRPFNWNAPDIHFVFQPHHWRAGMRLGHSALSGASGHDFRVQKRVNVMNGIKMRVGRFFLTAAKGSHSDLHGTQDKLGFFQDRVRRRFSKADRLLGVVSVAFAGLLRPLL